MWCCACGFWRFRLFGYITLDLVVFGVTVYVLGLVVVCLGLHFVFVLFYGWLFLFGVGCWFWCFKIDSMAY